MANSLKTTNIYFFLICLISFSNQSYIKYVLKSERTDVELTPLAIKSQYICENWLPSLMNPVLIIQKTTMEGYDLEQKKAIQLNNLFIDEKAYACNIYDYFFNDQLTTYLGICDYENNNNYIDCYFGLSPSVPNSTKGFGKEEYNLAILKNNNGIEKKIFSFDKWEIMDEYITTSFYLGDTHEHFKSTDGYIGKCNMTDNEYWGCSFQNMTFNNTVIPLSKEDKSLYKIYFTSESYDIILPAEFKAILLKASDEKCSSKIYNTLYYLECEGLNSEDYIPLKLSNEDMNITVEIDYSYKYSIGSDIPKSKTRIAFNYIDYLLFPLAMFKQFHIEFNSESKTISFYTKDSTILELPPKKPVEKNNVLIIFAIILLAIILIAIIVGVVYFVMKKCKTDIEKDINRFTKYEDEEDFKNMNEKGIF